MTHMQDIIISTADGFELDATLFRGTGTKPPVLINSATAVPRKIYRRLALHLADAGASHVLTYDYRGIGKAGRARLSRSQLYKVRMLDWATGDMPAALETLLDNSQHDKAVSIGHSFGGHAFGLSGVHNRLERFATIAAGSGYLANTHEPVKLNLMMNVLGRTAAYVLGYVPASAGMGEDLPAGVFADWRRWCNSPDYFMSDETVPQRHRFRETKNPILMVGMADDPWATRQSVLDLASWYQNARINHIWISPESVGEPVGHFGFFKPQFAERLWPLVSNWLLNGTMPGTRRLKMQNQQPPM